MKHLKKKALCLFMLLVIALSSVQIGAVTETVQFSANDDLLFRNESCLRSTGKLNGEHQYVMLSIDTPNGTPVDVKVYVFDVELPPISTLDTIADAISPTAYRFRSAAPQFNGHSFVWCSQNESHNQFWMPNPAAFYSPADQSYYEVSTPITGDIICYFNAAGSNVHSGIVVGTKAASTGLASGYIVESKWGPYGVYRHNGYECPYTSYYKTNDPYTSGDAKTVKFYRRSNHTHSFSKYTNEDNDYYHLEQCNSCGLKVHQPHVWTKGNVKPACVDNSNALVQFFCTKCGAMTLTPNAKPPI